MTMRTKGPFVWYEHLTELKKNRALARSTLTALYSLPTTAKSAVAWMLVAALVPVFEANTSCGLTCSKGEFRCNGDAVESCNADGSGWSSSTCRTAKWPDSHCVSAGICSFTKDPATECAGERESACLNNTVVICYRGYATGGPAYQECGGGTCSAGAHSASCTALDAGAQDQ